MQFLWKYIDDLVGKGLDFNQIALLLFYASARFVPIALPIAMLLASVMVFGKLGEQYELVALKSAGISLPRMLFPITLLVITVSYGSFLFSNYVMPIANLKNGSMIYDIQKKKPSLNIKEGIFYKDIEGFSIKINEKNTSNNTLKEIIIYDHTSKSGNDKVIIAESGIMQLTPDEKFLTTGESELPMKLTAHAGFYLPYNKRHPDDGYFSPNILFQQQGAATTGNPNARQLNFGFYTKKGPLVAGLWYRFEDAIIAIIGIQAEYIRFGYSYDITTSQLSLATGGAHEISFALNLDCKPKRVKFRPLNCPKF